MGIGPLENFQMATSIFLFSKVEDCGPDLDHRLMIEEVLLVACNIRR